MQKRAKNKGPITIAAVFGEDLAARTKGAPPASATDPACNSGALGASSAPVKRKRRSRMMEYFAGLDVSIEETAICVVGDDGKVVLETEVPTEPQLIADALERYAGRLRRVGHEAGSISPWLHAGMLALGLPAVCLETRHVRAALSAQRNKTDAADALGIAHIMRTGWFREAHIKTEDCYRIRLLLVQRRNLKRKFLDIENAIRHSLKVFGIRLGKVGRGSMEGRARGGGRRSDDRRADGLHAQSSRGAVGGVPDPAQAGHPAGDARRAVPPVHGDPRRRSGDLPELQECDRRSRALPPLAQRRGIFRAHLAPLAVG